MDNFARVGEPVNFETDKFVQFVRQRRSHRHFKQKPIPRQDLETLIDAVRYAPTGSNVQTVQIIVVQNPERIQKLSDLTVDYFDQAGSKAAEQLEILRAEGKEAPEKLQAMENTLRYRDRLVLARETGLDPIFYRAPALIIFHSPVQTSTPKDNCVIASTTMGLLARTMGLETTYIGLFEAASKTHQPLIDDLGLPEGNQVFSALIIGQPRLKFLRTIDRKPIETRWE
jgi:nitroreductase